jgi:glutathione peroxidase
MKYFAILFLALISCASAPAVNPENFDDSQTIYQFKVEDINGEVFDFANLKGKKILIVNTASKCGLTKQYEELQKLYETYKDQNFVIVGFPANNFLSQEPGSNDDIAEFCQKNYGVEFPMMAKISVKGKDQHELYQFLTQKTLNGFDDSSVSWNFQKYLIGTNGKVEKVVSPKTTPLSDDIVNWVKG